MSLPATKSTDGIYYKEWTVPRRLTVGDSNYDWSRNRLPPPSKGHRPCGKNGPRSLAAMATTLVAQHFGDVTLEMLDDIPARPLWRIWNYLDARKSVSLHAWALLSNHIRREEGETTLALYRFRDHICAPEQGLRYYIQPLTSPTVDFIAHLVISGKCDFETSELLCLAKMKNLGVLELIQPADDLHAAYPEVSDRLVRGWTEVDSPFPLLRVLRIWGDRSVTQQSLRWVAKFPSLALYDVRGAREDWPSPNELALESGWELTPSSRLTGTLMRYLMLFAPPEVTNTHGLRDLPGKLDDDLVSLCGDSRSLVKFVAGGQAPALLDYLNGQLNTDVPIWNPDAVDRTCYGEPFEAWAFWLYSFIGQLHQDADLSRNGIRVDAQAVVGPFVLPSKPMACLYLGHSGRRGIATTPSYVSRGMFQTQSFVFRRSLATVHKTEPPAEQPAPPSDAPHEPTIRNVKRKRMDDLLAALSR
ncbi:hypothetical protein B0I35DRAFT_476276 [Stachybotrys elegans]|uniref:Succinyl-3-ketoacid-coenzyme a transferase n=1 Tax=Stachybotrys elegans TaxID=80388 RepID=A0A8K0WUD5_9HYPO|nr:hypothetical protein B0I35DRAFT_476276 [Stachybotrys elegans]